MFGKLKDYFSDFFVQEESSDEAKIEELVDDGIDCAQPAREAEWPFRDSRIAVAQ